VAAIEPTWNCGGFCNNAVQRVRVTAWPDVKSAIPSDAIPPEVGALLDDLHQRGYSTIEKRRQ
jgi:hypothetical protein